MSSSLLTLILSYYSLSSQKNTFSQLIHTGHSHRSSHTEHPIDATFSFPSTQIQQDHTHHTTHSSSNEVFSVSSSSSSMRYDKTTQHKKLHDKMIDLIKERQQEYLWEWQSKNKITLFSSKILFYLTKQHQSAHCPIHVQYVFNTQKNTYVLLIINDLSQGERMNTITSLPSRVRVYLTSLCSGCWGHPRYDDGFIFHRSEYITHNPLSHMTYHNLPLISHDPSLLMTITDDLSPIIITYALWPCLMTYDLYLMTMTYDHDFYLMTLIVTHHTWLWPITTHDFYLISPIINNHHLWPMTYPSEPSPMTYHSQLITHEYDFSPMTVIHDYHPWPLSPMTIRTVTYDHHLWPMTYDLWSMIYDYHLSPITVTHDYPWPWLITCHSWLIQNHDWSHMIIAHDYQGLSLMTIIHDYEQYLWTSPMTIRPYDLWFITCEYHTRLLPMTIIHDYAHHTWLCPSHDLPQLTMTATHDYDCHPWLWISLTIYHHSWLAYITRDYHLCMSPMTVTDPLSLVMTTYHPWHSSHKIITHDHDYHSSLMTMTSYSQLAPMPYHSCLIIHVLSLMSIYDHHDLWLMIYNSSLVTITSDHHSWPSFMTIRSDHLTSHPWLLTHGY